MDCLFCKILAGDIPAKEVYSDDSYFAFEDINPQAPHHILIIPRKHIETINDLQEADKELVGGMFLAAKKIAKEKGISESGYRLVFNCNAGRGARGFSPFICICLEEDHFNGLQVNR